MKVLQKLPLFAVLLSLAATPLAAPAQAPAPAPASKGEAQAAPAKKIAPAMDKAIRHLLKLSKASESGEMILDGMVASLKRSMQSVPESFWKELPRKELLRDFENELVAIYAKHLTLEEIQGITKFYESPLGKSALEKMRSIAMESSGAGQEFSSTVLRWVMDEAEKKGVLPNQHGH
jgi:hypothetical protein